MVEDLIIISTFANSPQKVSTLLNLVLSLKKTEREILVMSHYPIPLEVQKAANYCIFDGRDELLTDEDYLVYNKGIHKFFADSHPMKYESYIHCSGQHSYSIYQNLQNAIAFASKIGKKFIYYTEYDNIIDEKDYSSFDKIKEKLAESNKNAYFERIADWGDMISACMFAGTVNFFENLLPVFLNKKDYLEYFKIDFMFEYAIGKLLSSRNDVLYIETGRNEIKIMPNSKANIFDFKNSEQNNFNSHANMVMCDGVPCLVIFNGGEQAKFKVLLHNTKTEHSDNKDIILNPNTLFSVGLKQEKGDIYKINVFYKDFTKMIFEYTLEQGKEEEINRRGKLSWI